MVNVKFSVIHVEERAAWRDIATARSSSHLQLAREQDLIGEADATDVVKNAGRALSRRSRRAPWTRRC